jgi:malonyl-CoA/methylmalonyl-CoA synthetase
MLNCFHDPAIAEAGHGGNMNLFARFSESFTADGQRTFIERPDGTRLSYAELLDATGRLANCLVSLGVAPGDRVAVQVEKSVDAILLYLACLRAGAVYLPLNAAYTVTEVAYFLSDAKPILFVCRPEDESAMRGICAEGVAAKLLTLGSAAEGSLLAAMREAPAAFEDVERAGSDLAAILYTSGTTGRSKGAMLTHDNLASNCRTLVDLWRFTPEDRLLHALPIFHSHGLFVATNTSLSAGCSMIFLPSFDAGEIIRLLPRATVMMGVPTFYTRLLNRPDFNRQLVRKMRLFVSGSAPLSAETYHEFVTRTGHEILERYGMTETNMNSSNPYDGDRVPGSVGLPLPGVDIRIVDPDTGRPAPGKTGVIEIRGPNVFPGYWRMPEKTQAEFRADGFFISGDLGHFDERGYLHIVGRAKDLIISGGFNVYPAEVEAVIEELSGVEECAVIGVPHPDFGEGVVAVLVAKPGRQVSEAGVTRALADRLAKYKQPKRFHLVDELPRNAMGKVQKKELRERYAETFTKTGEPKLSRRRLRS